MKDDAGNKNRDKVRGSCYLQSQPFAQVALKIQRRGRRELSKLKSTQAIQMKKLVPTAFSPLSIHSPGFGNRNTLQLLTYRYQNMNNRAVLQEDFDIWGAYTEGFDAPSSVQNMSSVQNESSVQNGSSIQNNGSYPFSETSNHEPHSTPRSVQKFADVQANANNKAADKQHTPGFLPQPWT